MPKIVTMDEMRAIEAATDAAGIGYARMMDLAGRAVADLVEARMTERPGGRVVVLVGPGNNGGDGLVAGRLVAEETDAEVAFYLLKQRAAKDPNLAKVVEAGLPVTVAAEDKKRRALRDLITDADIVVDALLGTGARLPVKGGLARLLTEVGRVLEERRSEGGDEFSYGTPAEPRVAWGGEGEGPVVVAVDCPSGLDCDTGQVDRVTLPADETVTFAAAKIGQVRFPGTGMLGRLHVADIGTPPDLKELQDIKLELADGPMVRGLLPPRPLDAHKGTFGKALVVAGSVNYVGAAALAAKSAYRVGAGWVTVAAPEPVVPMLAAQVTEATWLLLPHDIGVLAPEAAEVLRKELKPYSAMLLGPGWGRERPTAGFMRELLWPEGPQGKRPIGFVRSESEAGEDASLPPLVIDADGLNLLAAVDDWPTAVPPGSILTPHPGEMSRLCGIGHEQVQADRVGLARDRAADWGCVVVLKGAHTVVAAPDGRVCVMPFATPALATAGTGDVLAGAILGFRAQGLKPFAAAVAGAYLQGLAGAEAAEELLTAASVTAGDVCDMLPMAMAMVERAVH